MLNLVMVPVLVCIQVLGPLLFAISANGFLSDSGGLSLRISSHHSCIPQISLGEQRTFRSALWID